MNYPKILKNTALGLVILFSLLIIGTSLSLFGNRQFVVESGSMEPKIKTGSVVVDQTGPDYKVGDVITFRVAGSKDTITHRIVGIKPDNQGAIFYQVKGDANAAPDTNLVAKDNVVGKVAFSIPYIGYLINYIKTPPGLALFIIIPAAILIYHELVNINSEIAKLRASKRKVRAEVEKIESALETEKQKITRSVAKTSKGKQGTKPQNIVMGLFLVFIAALTGLGATTAALSDSVNLTGVSIAVGRYPSNTADCKNNGWETFGDLGFKNQGDCVSWVEHNILGHGTPAAD